MAVTYLLKHGADVNALNAYQNTPLHAACIEGLADCSKALLEAGADLQMASSRPGRRRRSSRRSGRRSPRASS